MIRIGNEMIMICIVVVSGFLFIYSINNSSKENQIKAQEKEMREQEVVTLLQQINTKLDKLIIQTREKHD